MYEFTELADVEHCLESLSTREPEPLVAPMPRGRWTHLLSGIPDPTEEPPATPTTDVENRLATLEREVADLKQMLESFRRQFE